MAALLLVPLTASAQMPPTSGRPDPMLESGPTPLYELLQELTSNMAGERSYAASEIKRRTMVALRRAESNGTGIGAMEARITLADLAADVPRVAVRGLRHDNIRKSCAQMLAALDATESIESLKFALKTEKRKAVRKALQEAIDHLEQI